MKPFFVFSGQGAQAVGMGKDLVEAFPAAKARFEEADAVLGYDQSSIIFDGPAEKLTESRYCQPAIYTMSCAALDAFRFAEGLKLLAQRAELMDRACRSTSGGMASVLSGDPEVIREVCAACGIDVANFNSPGQIVISGEKEKLAEAVEELKNRGMRKVIVLNVAGAFHSRLMAPAGEALKPVLEATPMTVPAVPVYHNYTAAPAKDAAELRANLAAQVAGSVRWEECVRAMVAAGGDAMIEFGPGNVLTGLLRRTLPDVPYFNVNSVESLDSLAL